MRRVYVQLISSGISNRMSYQNSLLIFRASHFLPGYFSFSVLSGLSKSEAMDEVGMSPDSFQHRMRQRVATAASKN